MEINKLLNASPQGSGVDGDATDAPIHGTDHGFKRKRITTTPVTVAEAATRDTRHTKSHTTESQSPNNNDGRSAEPPSKKRKTDHAIQQEADEEVIRVAPLSLPVFSLAHRGRLSARSDIVPYTRELDHDATVTAITGEEDGVFICRIDVQIANTADSCTGFCKIPIAEMDNGLAEYYRTRPDLAEDLELEEICIPGTFSGLVRLGRVVDEDYTPGTYTCGAEFGLFEAVSPWVAKVDVPKKHVPDYKLVDWEGEQNAVTSIETSGEKPKVPEHEPYRRHTVLFSRYIEHHQEQMSITIWSTDGKYYYLASGAQVLAYEFDGPQIYLEFRVRQCEASWWHFHGRMHRGLRNGRFNLSKSSVLNMESDARFGVDWPEQTLESDTPQRLGNGVSCSGATGRNPESSELFVNMSQRGEVWREA